MSQQIYALISYDDSRLAGSRDRPLADQLAERLGQDKISARVSGYSSVQSMDDPYQWLIVIYSPYMKQSKSSISAIINSTLDRAVKRDMRGVLLVTTGPASIPDEWATIRTYNASTSEEISQSFEGILRSTRTVKVPKVEPSRARLITPIRVGTLVLALLVILSGSFFIYHQRVQIRPPSIPIIPTPKPISVSIKNPQQLYAYIVKRTPTIIGFQQNKLQWVVDHSSNDDIARDDIVKCGLSEPQEDAYHAMSIAVGQYTPCIAEASQFKNFAYQITLETVGETGGIIFRDDNEGNYYRFSVTNSPDGNDKFYIGYCYYPACQGHQNADGQALQAGKVKIKPGSPVTLTVIAQNNTINLYVNGSVVGHTMVIDGGKITLASGRIGVYAAAVKHMGTDVTFSDLKIWVLA